MNDKARWILYFLGLAIFAVVANASETKLLKSELTCHKTFDSAKAIPD